ncbi:two-component system sensor histidine kinase NtrB [Pseudomarimonas salicorniae]|uniref:Sensory histidine kinase/phosphatase NtrB n=1 Tax=Pseudomarimonas salicorniae TaxID=2933270 RepID=A0ABT0GFW5_9GAMM|nr:ATP-binding protein [Lysobacter sp. CAU 1642]MCK7593433.1 ATP-binding protein [Lysobacter sp. CAU 1642]
MNADTHPIDALSTPILSVDGQGRIKSVNPAAASWLGLGLRRLLGHPLSRIASSEQDLDALCERARSTPSGLRVQRLRLQPGELEPRFAHVLVTALEQPEGGVRFEFHPVDEFPGDDPAVLLPTALNVALKGLAHEVKNPLAGLKGAAQLLRRRLQDTDSERYLDVIVAETERLSALVQRLLEPAPPSPLAATNVHTVLERVRLLAEAEAGWAVRLVRDYDPSLPEIPADADRLTQAVLNLVRNALQADAGEVRLRTRADTGVVIGDVVHRLALRIEIVDDGCGVPEGLAEQIFLPLVSGRAEGTGLGLALAQQVAREHGGSLSYRSRRGHTVFTLLLPATMPPAAA